MRVMRKCDGGGAKKVRRVKGRDAKGELKRASSEEGAQATTPPRRVNAVTRARTTVNRLD